MIGRLFLKIAICCMACLPLGVASNAASYKVIHRFADQATAFPYYAPVMGADGKLYGVTGHSSPYGPVKVFRLSPPAAAGGDWSFDVLWSFSSGSGIGGEYGSPLIVVGQGDGLTIYGSVDSFVFSLKPDGGSPSGWRMRVLYQADNMISPGLVRNRQGTIFGVQSSDPPYSQTIFSLDPKSRPAWKVTTLYRTQTGKIAYPSGLSLGDDGSLYGSSAGGGKTGYGSVFRLSPPEAGADRWEFSTLYSFRQSQVLAGGAILSPVTVLSPDELVSTSTAYHGEVFRLKHDGTRWRLEFIHKFDRSDGTAFDDPITAGRNGRLLGSAITTLYSLSPPEAGEKDWAFKILHRFRGGSDGSVARGGMTAGPGGKYYGVTRNGGGGPCETYGCGTIYELKP